MSNESRIFGEKVNIDEEKVKEFYKTRAARYDGKNMTTLVTLQDKDSNLAQARDINEEKTVIPLLKLKENHKVLDIGCGGGRWIKKLFPFCSTYCGIDIIEDFINIANLNIDKSQQKDIQFYNMSFLDFVSNSNQLKSHNLFDRVIIGGVCMYINDEELYTCLNELDKFLEKNTIVYIREPIGIYERLTLNNIYSEELDSNYSAVYRKVDEYKELLNKTLIKYNFKLINCKALFTPELKNRKETEQYIFMLER